MSEQQEMITPVPADKPTTRRRSLLRGVAVGSLTLLVMVTGVALYLTGRGMLAMDTRLATLEQQQGERLTAASLAPLQSRLSELETKLQAESARLAQLARQPVLTEVQQTQLKELPASLEQIQAAQKALSLRLDTLAALAEKPQPRAVQPESPSASGTGEKGRIRNERTLSGGTENCPPSDCSFRYVAHLPSGAVCADRHRAPGGAVICGGGTPGIYQPVAGGTARGR